MQCQGYVVRFVGEGRHLRSRSNIAAQKPGDAEATLYEGVPLLRGIMKQTCVHRRRHIGRTRHSGQMLQAWMVSCSGTLVLVGL